VRTVAISPPELKIIRRGARDLGEIAHMLERVYPFGRYRAVKRGDYFLLGHRHRINERLHRGFTEAPAALMRACLIIFADSAIQIDLQLLD
jgi:hypothetical protein